MAYTLDRSANIEGDLKGTEKRPDKDFLQFNKGK